MPFKHDGTLGDVGAYPSWGERGTSANLRMNEPRRLDRLVPRLLTAGAMAEAPVSPIPPGLSDGGQEMALAAAQARRGASARSAFGPVATEGRWP
jgi:hypothetical protein